MRIRNLLLILVIQYILLVIISVFVELNAISNKAREVTNIIRTAADMAIHQSQIVDDYMGYAGRDDITVKMPRKDGAGFEEVNLFYGVYGLDPNNPGTQEQIFQKLYNTNDFKMLANRLGAMRKPVRYWNTTRSGLDWYYIPTVSMIGTEILPKTQATVGVRNGYGQFVPESFANELFATYGLDTSIHVSGGREYYYTPLNLGITYLNPDLLGSLFMNNLDLLMRQKYNYNLNTPDGGNGVLRGQTYASKIRGDLAEHNPINNGSFTILRGQENFTASHVKSFTGVRPTILYKVIDMYDSRNDEMLVRVFGAYKGTYSSKAEYLKSLDSHIINPVTGAPYQSKPIVIAKVTFYVDTIIPYFTLIAREMRGTFVLEDNNFLEIRPSEFMGVDGTRRISYTRYFAVTP